MQTAHPKSRRQTSLLQHHSQQTFHNQDGSISFTNQQHQQHQQPQQSQQSQPWLSYSYPSSLPLTPQSTFPSNSILSHINSGVADHIPYNYNFQPQQSSSNQQLQSQSFMPPASSTWMSNGPLTPTSTSRQYHHRESSLSSSGSPAAPASPYAPSTLNPQVAGDSYHDYQDYLPTAPKILTPQHTPLLQENFLSPQYPNYYQNQNNPSLMMFNDSFSRSGNGSNELMSAPEFHSQGSSMPSIATVASNDSPSTQPTHEDEKQGLVHRTSSYQMPKLDRTETDIRNDGLLPSFDMESAPSPTPTSTRASAAPRNDVFAQRLQAAAHQHLNENKKEKSTLSPRERSPFQPNSPLAPSSAEFHTQNMGFATATRMREQRKAENDALALREQYDRTSQGQVTPKTISPKDVDLVYHESEEDSNNPLFPPPRDRQTPVTYIQQPLIVQEPFESEEISLSQQSYASMATTRGESPSTYSTNSQSTSRRPQINFATPALSGSVRQIPQHYPFVASSQRQSSNMSNMSNDFPPTLTSMESSSSDYSRDHEIRRPSNTLADSGTYTCTYHGCTLRFETPAKLQKHKRESHRNSTSAINNMGGENGGGMTSMAPKLNSQSGPHKCERVNPSTGKPCNTVFSRPYDLTRHEDTIHNSGKQKLRCKYCTEEKTFSRNDALTRHMKVVHSDIPISTGKGRRRGAGLGGGMDRK